MPKIYDNYNYSPIQQGRYPSGSQKQDDHFGHWNSTKSSFQAQAMVWKRDLSNWQKFLDEYHLWKAAINPAPDNFYFNNKIIVLSIEKFQCQSDRELPEHMGPELQTSFKEVSRDKQYGQLMSGIMCLGTMCLQITHARFLDFSDFKVD